MAASWIDHAVFYEIYPQSFCDSNGDGIGDIPGMLSKLDYIKSLGCNAIWINPCFDSPFADAGYDVRDYKLVAPRYGTNDDLVHFFQEAHARGIHVILDLVPCHTSEEHEWFRESCKDEENEFSHRYIWTSGWWEHPDTMPFVGGAAQRDGCYIISFFKTQPALNFGYGKVTAPWQHKAGSPETLKTRDAIWDVMQFWLSKGCDGFRVDMAGAIVKDDPEGKPYTQEFYRDIKGRMEQAFPEAVLVAEWGEPTEALNCGFDCDFYLDWAGRGYHALARNYEGLSNDGPKNDKSYFKRGSGADALYFLSDYLPRYYTTKDKGQWSFITCNHDTTRPRYNLTPEELKNYFGFIFTMPGAPFLYYGDEIGMRYYKLTSKEGGYTRTGSRTPMQWAQGRNLGFSEGKAEDLYLPVDPAADAPTVQAQEADPDSLLCFTRRLLAFRESHADLQNRAPFTVYSAEAGSRLFAYKRGELLVAVNPDEAPLTLKLDKDYVPAFVNGTAQVESRTLTVSGFAVLEPKD